MPDLDHALICDYVRAEGNLAHAIAAGIDTIGAPTVPTGQNIGLLARFSFSLQECGRAHRVEVIFQNEDGERLTSIEGLIAPVRPDGLPPGMRTTALFAANVGLPLPDYGQYSFEILVNDTMVKSIALRVVPLTPPPPPSA